MEWETEEYSGRVGINEIQICRELLAREPMVWQNSAFFTRQGRVKDENQIRQMIYERIEGRIGSSVNRKVDNILGVLKLEAAKSELKVEDSVIHVANGLWSLENGFSEDMRVCRYRLPVSFRPNTPNPKLWLEFLDQLLEPEDIPTLQEFMGYCLIPTNIGQRMLIITGRGGEGKSRIGVVMRALLGDNMNVGSLYKLETNQFARADLEHKLLMVDDDLNLNQLPSTHNLKTITTAETAMDLERKGIQSYQGELHCRLMAFGNGTVRAANDSSFGFYRRQIVLKTKPRDPRRVDDPYLGKRLIREADQIFLWCLSGVQRLFENDFQFTQSAGARENLRQILGEGNHIHSFMNEKGYFLLSPENQATSRQIYGAYRQWCEDNGLDPMTSHKFSELFRMDAGYYGLKYVNNIFIGEGRRARGYRGIQVIV